MVLKMVILETYVDEVTVKLPQNTENRHPSLSSKLCKKRTFEMATQETSWWRCYLTVSSYY